MRFFQYVITSFILLSPLYIYSQAPVELSEINPNIQGGSSPNFFVPLPNDIVVFSALDGVENSYDIFATDGTTGNTIKLKETSRVDGDDFFATPFGRFGDRVLFRVSGLNGIEIWATDGTLQNTVRLVETNIAASDNDPSGPNNISSNSEDFKFYFILEFSEDFTAPNFQKMLFTAGTTQTGVELWSTDGTPQGTGLVSDINPGPLSSNPYFVASFASFTTSNLSVYLTATTPTFGRELYISNGTSAGTVFLGDLEPGTTGAFDLPENDPEFLEVAPLSAGTFFLQNPSIAAQPDLFPLYTTANGHELWTSNGTAQTTFLVSDINPGPDSSIVDTAGDFTFNYGYFTNFTNNRSILIFAADDGTNGVELWRSNASTSGTFLLKDFDTAPGVSGFGDQVVDISQVNNFGVFPVMTTANGLEPWVTSGSAPSTQLLKDIFPGQGPSLTLSSFGFAPVQIANPTTFIPERLLFFATTPTQGIELWTTDGTNANTQITVDLTPGTGSSFPQFTAFGEIASIEFFNQGTLGFIANSPSTGLELFVTNGNPGNATLLKDINPGVGSAFADWGELEYVPFSPNPQQPSDLILFAAIEAATGRELWKSDGTTNGTVLVKDINPGTNFGLDLGGDFLSGIFNFADEENGRFWFIARDGDGVEPWYTDATTNGTQQLKDINVGPGDSDPLYGLISGDSNGTPTSRFRQNGKFLIAASTESTGRELWVSDGTEANTVLTGQIAPGSSSGINPNQNAITYYEAGAEVVFGASDFNLTLPTSEFPLNTEPWAYTIGEGTTPTCTYTVTPLGDFGQLPVGEPILIPASGITASFRINTQTGCDWVVTGLAEWIDATITSGTGSDTTILTFAANPVTSQRSQAVVIAGTSYTFTQFAAQPQPDGDLFLFY